VVHAEAQRHEGKEKDNFLPFFFAASRLCVIKNARDGCAGSHLSALCWSLARKFLEKARSGFVQLNRTNYDLMIIFGYAS
jgi:hypothetical protein